MSSRKALIVRGGWDGHHPVESTDAFIPFLAANDFDVTVEESTGVYADAETMAGVDLVLTEAASITDSLKQFSARGELHHNGDVSGGEKNLTENDDRKWLSENEVWRGDSVLRYRPRTSLKRTIFGCRRDRWLMISR